MVQHDWRELILLSLVALAVGSFVSALVVRLPSGTTMLGRSHCPKCGATLAPVDLVPLLSWIAFGGRCRHCRAPIGLLYPALELAAFALALWAASVASGWLLWASCALGWVLLALAVIDLRTYLLPDVLTLPLVPAGMAVTWLMAPEDLWLSAMGAAGGYILFALVAWLYRRSRGR